MLYISHLLLVMPKHLLKLGQCTSILLYSEHCLLQILLGMHWYRNVGRYQFLWLYLKTAGQYHITVEKRKWDLHLSFQLNVSLITIKNLMFHIIKQNLKNNNVQREMVTDKYRASLNITAFFCIIYMWTFVGVIAVGIKERLLYIFFCIFCTYQIGYLE